MAVMEFNVDVKQTEHIKWAGTPFDSNVQFPPPRRLPAVHYHASKSYRIMAASTYQMDWNSSLYPSSSPRLYLQYIVK